MNEILVLYANVVLFTESSVMCYLDDPNDLIIDEYQKRIISRQKFLLSFRLFSSSVNSKKKKLFKKYIVFVK